MDSGPKNLDLQIVNLNHTRYSDIDFPPYRYLPTVNAHPRRDPQGHSYRKDEPKAPPLAPEDWKKNELYLYGVDLYNHAFWWEAHEAWEAVWHTTHKESDYGQYIQGLIQISASFIKWQIKEESGVLALYKRGSERLKHVQKTHVQYMGLNLNEYLKELNRHFSWLDEPAFQRNSLPNLVQSYPFIQLNLF